MKLGRFWFLQASWAWISLFPVTVYHGLKKPMSLGPWSYVSLGLFFVGFVIESVADYQKLEHKLSEQKGFMRDGVWKYSRHPNYFGEILIWWSLWGATLPTTLSHPWAIISPIFVTFLLLKVSGIPLAEQNSKMKYGDDSAYKHYVNSTNIVVPWFPRT
jgi:steroid 5-alpha reductase family enzyme